jgi:hypothetical protein|tara:strand:+ start:117 stop:431 length:315 start_codon:yes stop_codon:yes gene_type:complete
MKKPVITEIYACNGALSHYALIDTETGEKLWSEAPDECEAMGFPVKNDILLDVNGSLGELINDLDNLKRYDCECFGEGGVTFDDKEDGDHIDAFDMVEIIDNYR